jgi:iron complex outermembrane receptor protein
MGTTAIMLLSLLIAAQTSFQHIQRSSSRKKVMANQFQELLSVFGNQQISANEQGLFTIKAFKKTNFNISSVGFENGSFTIPSNLDQVHIFELKPFQLFLQPLEVKAIRASDRSPFTKNQFK